VDQDRHADGTPNATAAPDGTTTADRSTRDAGNDAKNISQNTSPAEVQGELRCYSIFVKANNLPNISFRISTSNFGINFNLGTGVIDSTNGRARGERRHHLAALAGLVSHLVREARHRDARHRSAPPVLPRWHVQRGSYTGTSRTFFAWGAMAERTSNLNGPTPYIKTPSSAAVTVTDYTLSRLGVVTPARCCRPARI
jgi:hypothetical protein